MQVAVIGSGYVGLVAGACLADVGNHVVCADIDAAKIARLNRGEVPIYEPGLEPIIESNLEAGRLTFTTDVGAAVEASSVIFIAVGTPPGEDGSADLGHVLAVARTIGERMNGEKVVITKSTVPVGTAVLVKQAIQERSRFPVHVCSNPEFLKEGAAIDDFMKPDRVVVGVDSDFARSALAELYEPFVRTGNPILFMDIASAEITKYAANAMLATRISFMNTIAGLAARVGADIDLIRKGIGTDERIGQHFLFAGCGYGGSCFPKDVKALIQTLRQHGVDASVLEAVEEVNEQQKRLLVRAVVERFGNDLEDRTFAIWGLSFKPETDDMREAPSLVVVEALLARGARVRVHDPQALEAAQVHFGGRVEYFEDHFAAAQGADALLILTEWRPYRRPDLDRLKTELRAPIVFDGRNILPRERMASTGFDYFSIGRSVVSSRPAAAEIAVRVAPVAG